MTLMKTFLNTMLLKGWFYLLGFGGCYNCQQFAFSVMMKIIYP